MSNRNLTILGLTAVLMVFLAVILSQRASKPIKSQQEGPAYLIQGLNMDNVQSISCKTTTDTTVLKRIQGKFFVSNKESYPVSIPKLNDLITKVLDIRAFNKVTDDPKNFISLGVDPNSARNIVKFMDQNNELITGVIVNDSRSGDQTHVRLLPTSDVYASGAVSWLPNAPMDFIEAQILDIQEKDIESVLVSDPNGSYTLVYDPNNDKIALEQDMPEGKKLKSSDPTTVIRALKSFRITDVMRSAKTDQSLKFDHTYICRLGNSTIYTIRIARHEGESFVKCSAEFTKEARVFIDENETDEQLKKKEEQLLAGDAVLEFNNNHGSWIYKIAEYKADELTKKLSDLLEELPQEEQEVGEPNESTEI
ncbi:MAG: DUF4340 domain-containing protein [Planctomycetota bacterium]|jgi:hypothetical protein